MLKRTLLAVLTAFIIVAAQSSAFALPEPLEIVNETGQPITNARG